MATGTVVVAAVRHQALENLWAAWKNADMERVGYSPEFTAAVKELRELERMGYPTEAGNAG